MRNVLLSFDGGGEHGRFTLRLLRRIQDQCNILAHPGLIFAGTSFGAILAEALACGRYSPADLEKIMDEQASSVFLRNPYSCFGLLGPKYLDGGRHELLRHLLPHPPCPGRFINSPCYVTAFDLVINKAAIIEPGREFSWVDAAMASSAAPTYWNPWLGLVDGGVVAGNPASIVADKIGKDMDVISIGTGTTVEPRAGTSGEWGLLRWGHRILDVFQRAEDTYPMPSNVERYIRVNGVRPPSEMDDYSPETIEGLTKAADAVDISVVVDYIKGLK